MTAETPTLATSVDSGFRWGVIAGSVLECLLCSGFGFYTLWLGIALNGRIDAFANDLNFLGAAVLLALTAGFACGAFLTTSRWIDRKIAGGRIIGGVVHLGATGLAAWGAIAAGLYQENVDPTYGYWSPLIAFAVAALVIATGVAVIVWLDLGFRRVPGRGGGI